MVVRLSVTIMQVNLPAQLAVDLLHCECAARQAVAESNGQLRLVQGELITAEYFDNLAAEIDEILQVCYAMLCLQMLLMLLMWC